MRSPEDVEKLIVETRIKPRLEMRSKVLPDALKTQKELNARNNAGVSVSSWRKIMNSRITKYAAAALIVIAVFVGIKLTGGSIGVTTVAWSQVVEQISGQTKYKCRQRVVRQQGPPVPTMQVYHLNLQQRRQEVENGDVHIIDMRGEDAITLQLYPNQKKAIVTKMIGFGPKKDPHIIEMVKQYEKEPTERLGTKKADDKILHGFRHQPNEHNEFTVWVGPDTKLPVEVEIKHLKTGQTIFMDQFEFDFAIDPSAFSTDVPDGYEIENLTLDYRPTEPKEITAEDIRTGLNHAAYTAEKLPWMKKIIMTEAIDPLGTKAIVYVTGIQSNDGNMIIIVQGNYYDIKRMVWIPNQQRVLETPLGAKLYTHPNGALYAQYFLEAFAEAKPEFFNIEDLSEERFTRMIVLPDETVMGFSANKEMSDEKLRELVESLAEIKAN